MVDQLKDLADGRLISGCVYCGGRQDTRDHVPSRVFLDSPFPENLPVVPACRECNNGFSSDEEYLACLLEAVIAGSTDPDRIERRQVANILRRSAGLRARIESSKHQVDDQTAFHVDGARIENVLLKLARGHACFELSTPCHNNPRSLRWWPLLMMSAEERDAFDASQVIEMFGEIGSRQTQRLLVTQLTLRSPSGELSSVGLIVNDWVDVQEGRYRYLAIHERDEITIKIILREYLACEISWAV